MAASSFFGNTSAAASQVTTENPGSSSLYPPPPAAPSARPVTIIRSSGLLDFEDIYIYFFLAFHFYKYICTSISNNGLFLSLEGSTGSPSNEGHAHHHQAHQQHQAHLRLSPIPQHLIGNHGQSSESTDLPPRTVVSFYQKCMRFETTCTYLFDIVILTNPPKMFDVDKYIFYYFNKKK